MGNHSTKTTSQARESFRQRGIRIKDWANERGYSSNLVYNILAGRVKCNSGKSHQIAIDLGIKDAQV